MREKAVPFHGKMVFGCAAQQNERSISFIIDKFAIEIGICLFGLAMQTKNDVIHFNTRNSRLLDEKTNKSSNLRRQCYFRWRVRGAAGGVANSNQSKRLSFSTHVVTFAQLMNQCSKSTAHSHTHTQIARNFLTRVLYGIT